MPYEFCQPFLGNLSYGFPSQETKSQIPHPGLQSPHPPPEDPTCFSYVISDHQHRPPDARLLGHEVCQALCSLMPFVLIALALWSVLPSDFYHGQLAPLSEQFTGQLLRNPSSTTQSRGASPSRPSQWCSYWFCYCPWSLWSSLCKI